MSVRSKKRRRLIRAGRPEDAAKVLFGTMQRRALKELVRLTEEMGLYQKEDEQPQTPTSVT